MTLDLPAPIDQALLNERVQAWADALRRSSSAPSEAFAVEVDRLRKYWRIVTVSYGQRSAHAFLDPATGDVYKPAGWKAPAKGVRYNLLRQASYDALLTRAEASGGWAGGYLYR